MVNEEGNETNKKPAPIFKSKSFQEKFRPTNSSGKKRIWRSLKQVLAQERALPWPAETVHCKVAQAYMKKQLFSSNWHVVYC